MNAQRKLDVGSITNYRALIDELCNIYHPASKTAIADYIGISQKTIYNIIYGEPTGVYTQKKLAAFMQKEFGYQIKNIKDGIELEKLNTVIKTDVISNNYIILLLEETKRLRDRINQLERIKAPV